MGFFRSSGKFVYKTFLDVPSWMGWRKIKKDTASLYGIGKDIFTIKKIDQKETFEQAIERLQLSEQDIQKAKNYYFKLSLIFLSMTILCTLYTFYLFWETHFLSGLIALLVVAFSGIKTFSAHFQYFQIKNRKLNCTIEEWFNGEIKVSKQ